MPKPFVKLISTFCYVGYFPMAPGSAATCVGVAIYYFLQSHLWVYCAAWVVITFLGFTFTGGMEAVCKEKDPSCVVIDEVSGVMIAFFLLPLKWPVVVSAFFVFRAFDMFKIYPANKLEQLSGGAGIMLDDIIAGIYTNLVMHSALSWVGSN